jgi:hypothetical protein
MRVEIRDAEWRIQRVDRASDGGYLLHCVGFSKLVRGRSAQFLSKLEQNPRILDPVTTDLVDDLSSGYRDPQLFIDTVVGWDSVKDLPAGFKVLKTCTDNTHPGAALETKSRERTIEYIAPFVKSNRETDYELVWKVFANTLD